MAVVLTRYVHYDSVARLVGIRAADGLVTETTLATAITANRTVPVRTGHLRHSQRHRIRRVGLQSHGTIWYPPDYAMSQHEGSRRHIIRPRNPEGYLVFMHRGKLIRTKQVDHPGTRPNPWLFAALLIQAGRRDFIVTPR